MIRHPIDSDFIARIRKREPMRGIFNGLGSPALVEMCAYAGFDFTIIDNEHGSASLETTEHMLRAARAAGMPALVRCLEHDISRTLDAGAGGLQIPMIHTAEQARAIVAQVRYPRARGFVGDAHNAVGERGSAYSVRAAGYGAFGGAAHNAKSNHEVVLVLMIESMQGVLNAAEIASVDGVDAVFIGPNDLAHSMGYENRFHEPEVQDAMQIAVKAIVSTGKCAGILALTPEDEARYQGWGASYFATVITAVLTKSLKDHATAGRGQNGAGISY